MTVVKPVTYSVVQFFPLEGAYGAVYEPAHEIYSLCPVIATGLSLEEAVSLIKILRANAEES